MEHSFNQGPYIMGIINVTPDSFSDGGSYIEAEEAIDHGWRLVEEGADILDIGGESTRPDADPVSPQQEMDRVLPVIEGLKDCGKIISVDTRHAATMLEAANAGAGMINDVTALQQDDESMNAAANSNLPVCLMHMQGTPQTMQQNPQYDDVVTDVRSFLESRINACEEAGITKDRIVIDPGIGFGKTLQHNLTLLHNINELKSLEVPVLLGLSRKSFIEKICPGTPANDRLPGSIAAALWVLEQGADILRVHDVAATRQAVSVFEAIRKG